MSTIVPNLRTLRRGNVGPSVRQLQEDLQRVDRDLYTGRLDGDYGGLTERAVMRFQQYRLLDEDGIAGPDTQGDLAAALRLDWHPGGAFPHPAWENPVYGPYHPRLGWIPGAEVGAPERGKISTFGGPDDKGDRCYGQAYISGADSPAELIQKHPGLVKLGILRRDVSLFARYPEVSGVGGRRSQAGTSWALNPDGFYCAMRWPKSGGSSYRNEKNPRIMIWAPDRLTACVVLRTDWGPAKSTGRLIDLSPGAVRALGLRTDSVVYVCWALDGADLGPLPGPVPEVIE